MTAAVLPAISSDEYRRQARRLRCVYAGRPDRLQRSLKSLAARPTFRTVRRIEVNEVSAVQPGPATTFAQHLSETVPANGVLTYSQRVAMLQTAHLLGIRRFEANLLIAAVLEKRRRMAGAPAEVDASTRSGSIALAVALFLLIQGAFALGAWWMIFR